jgi:hypothetical protein
MELNDKGQCPCCGRKPLVYKRKRIRFCSRCDREYELSTPQQRPNFAWKKLPDGSWVEQDPLAGLGKE